MSIRILLWFVTGWCLGWILGWMIDKAICKIKEGKQ